MPPSPRGVKYRTQIFGINKINADKYKSQYPKIKNPSYPFNPTNLRSVFAPLGVGVYQRGIGFRVARAGEHEAVGNVFVGKHFVGAH